MIGADGEIAGFTIMNDWSARDLQRREMAGGSARRRARTSRPASARCWSRWTSSTGRPRDGRARERRGAFPRQLPRHAPPWQAIVAHAARNTHLVPGTSSVRGPSGAVASSSTAMVAGSGQATSSSWRSRASACCATRSAHNRLDSSPGAGLILKGVMENLLPIGQFAAASQLSHKALRLYAERGLLPPAWVDPDSGYRYYRPNSSGRRRSSRCSAEQGFRWPRSRHLLPSRGRPCCSSTKRRRRPSSPSGGGFSGMSAS